MAINLSPPTELHTVKGIKLATICAGISQKKQHDLILLECVKNSSVSTVFTRNLFCAAPVTVAKQHLAKGQARYFIINSGNANAATGDSGIDHALKICQAIAQQTETKPHQILPFSTGVIGEPLAYQKIIAQLPTLISSLQADQWIAAAHAMMTTDTVAKGFSQQVNIDGDEITITGIAKGSGMIKPNMATMLAFIAIDAEVKQSLLDRMLNTAINKSFNRITVDGDTSTNDACCLVATGQSKLNITDEHDPAYALLLSAVEKIFINLAQAIIRDGEGAQKFVQIQIKDGKDQHECLAIAYRIAESPLVKTALTASDPNWGRILAAIGNAGIQNLDINHVNIFLGELCIFKDGKRSATYVEEVAQKIMSQPEIHITITLGRGQHQETIWTTDMSHEYITINASYRS